MNNVYVQIVIRIVRALLVSLCGALLAHLSPKWYDVAIDIITLLGGQETVILTIGTFVATVLFSLLKMLEARVNLQTALKLPKLASVADVKLNAPSPLAALKNPNASL